MAIPSLLAVSALQQHLVQTKKRTAVALILESGEPREVHHFATLLGYGACAVNPYLAQDTILQLIDDHLLDKDYYAAVDDYNAAILHGIVKIASKMGISTLQSYEGSKIFEAVGIDRSVIDKYFTATVSRIGGITLEDIASDVNVLHARRMTRWGSGQRELWTAWDVIKCAAAPRSICTTPRPFICCSSPRGAATMICSNSIPAW